MSFQKAIVCLFLALTSLAVVLARGDGSSCKGVCLDSYNASLSCQCTSDCVSYGDCCADFNTYCTTGNYSCQNRCGIYDGTMPCECDPTCTQYYNCCPDYVDACSAVLNITCAGKCNIYDATQPCQCDSNCESYTDCCPDYLNVCGVSSCINRCGQAFDENAPCQCNSECEQLGTCCSDIVQYCDSGVTDGELQQLSQQLWDADADRLTVTIDLQKTTIDGSNVDNAQGPLCTGVPAEINTLTIYTTLQALFDNYQADESIVETTSTQTDAEIDAFLSQVVASQPMTLTFNYLLSKGIVAGTIANFQSTLRTIWFTLYNRQDVLSSSGAEDVLVGEVEQISSAVDGLYNWVRYCTLEQAGNINYLGYVSSQAYTGVTLVRFPYFWNSNFKPVGEILFGTSPAFDLSVYTLCYYTRANAPCNLLINAQPLTIQSYVNVFNRVNYVDTAYPVL